MSCSCEETIEKVDLLLTGRRQEFLDLWGSIRARIGPTYRASLRSHATARSFLHPEDGDNRFLQMPVTIYQTIQRHISEDTDLTAKGYQNFNTKQDGVNS
jgi:hypothetical protein